MSFKIALPEGTVRAKSNDVLAAILWPDLTIRSDFKNSMPMQGSNPRTGGVLPITLALLGLVAVAFLIWQRSMMVALHTEKADLQQRLAAMSATNESGQDSEKQAELVLELEKLKKDNAELNRLRNEVRTLREQVGQISRLQAENAALQSSSQQLSQQKKAAEAQLAQNSALQATEAAAAMSKSNACATNLKRIALAARLWAQEHDGLLPQDFPLMQAELNSTQILVCPADLRTPAANWEQYQPGNASYVIVSPGAAAIQTDAVYAQCPIHGHVCMVDGNVQLGQEEQ